ncbi:uncharacterized protein TNCV_4296171 [Trichonephila clavipes]|nr:uncharacterized protein TNCV_4296171 [Trichonephila clavipes]
MMARTSTTQRSGNHRGYNQERLKTFWGLGTRLKLVRAPDSGPEGLGSMPIPPNTLRVHAEFVLVKSVGLKVLWAESRVQETGKNFPPRQFHT